MKLKITHLLLFAIPNSPLSHAHSFNYFLILKDKRPKSSSPSDFGTSPILTVVCSWKPKPKHKEAVSLHSSFWWLAQCIAWAITASLSCKLTDLSSEITKHKGLSSSANICYFMAAQSNPSAHVISSSQKQATGYQTEYTIPNKKQTISLEL